MTCFECARESADPAPGADLAELECPHCGEYAATTCATCARPFLVDDLTDGHCEPCVDRNTFITRRDRRLAEMELI